MDDLISRRAAIDGLWKAQYEYEDESEKKFLESEDLSIHEWFSHRVFIQNMSDIDRKMILNLPSAQPERKKGKWKEHIFDGIMGGRPRALMCDQCNNLSLAKSNFCPNCGADMREV